jgi:hypothetical protein
MAGATSKHVGGDENYKGRLTWRVIVACVIGASEFLARARWGSHETVEGGVTRIQNRDMHAADKIKEEALCAGGTSCGSVFKAAVNLSSPAVARSPALAPTHLGRRRRLTQKHAPHENNHRQKKRAAC